ncbi:DUF4411 family protein [Syntrophomonas erecta]
MSIFVLDANVFIEAYKRYYSFDIAPVFWRALKQKAEAGLLVSIDRIYQEIYQYDDTDQLKIWVNSEFKDFFMSTDSEAVFDAYREVIEWAISQRQFSEAAKTEFASVAELVNSGGKSPQLYNSYP